MTTRLHDPLLLLFFVLMGILDVAETCNCSRVLCQQPLLHKNYYTKFEKWVYLVLVVLWHQMHPFTKQTWSVIACIQHKVTCLKLWKMFCMPSANLHVYFHAGEYKKDELLEAAR